MKKIISSLLLISSLNLYGTTKIQCPESLDLTVHVPTNWELEVSSGLKHSFIGSQFIKGKLNCFYGVGRLMLSKRPNGKLCRLNYPYENKSGSKKDRICYGSVKDCYLSCE